MILLSLLIKSCGQQSYFNSFIFMHSIKDKRNLKIVIEKIKKIRRGWNHSWMKGYGGQRIFFDLRANALSLWATQKRPSTKPRLLTSRLDDNGSCRTQLNININKILSYSIALYHGVWCNFGKRSNVSDLWILGQDSNLDLSLSANKCFRLSSYPSL